MSAWVRFVEKRLLRTLLVSTLLAVGCSDVPVSSRTSVVLVTIDTLRADHVGCYGGTVPTPRLDQLAGEGSVFLDVTAHSPLTLPSHASILTGTTPIYHGVKDNGRYRLPEEIDTLAEILREASYSTAAFVGALPVHSRFGLNQGFEVYDENFVDERRAAEVTAAAADWINRHGSVPLFVWVHLFDPHSPYEPPEAFEKEYGDTYEGEVAYLDQALGTLFSAIAEDTLTVVTSDHGESLGEHGEDTHALFIYDATLRVPLIFHGPGVPRGATFQEQARSIDIVPTVLELVGGTGACKACQGRSLVGLMRGNDVQSKPSYAETYFARLNLGWSELRSIRWEGWKYIAAPQPELYDLGSDPNELTNLVEEEPERVEKLAAELSAMEEEYVGPLKVEPSPLDPETSRLLRSLGYVGAENAPSVDGRLPDPKSKIDIWRKVIDAKDLSDKGQIDRAIGEFESILREDGKMLEAHYYLSEAYYRLGRYEATAEQCKKLLNIDPKHSRATILLAESLFRLGRVREAQKMYERAAELDRISAGPLVRLANLYFETGNIEMARAVLEQAAEREPGDPLVSYVKGKLFLVEGKVNEAEQAFRDAVEADPYEVGVRVHLANLLVGQKRFDEAESILREGLTLEADDAALHAELGRALAMSGKSEQAIRSFETALGLAPQSSVIMTSLGMAYLQNEQEEKAIDILTQSLKLNPNQPQVKLLLERQRQR